MGEWKVDSWGSDGEEDTCLAGMYHPMPSGRESGIQCMCAENCLIYPIVQVQVIELK